MRSQDRVEVRGGDEPGQPGTTPNTGPGKTRSQRLGPPQTPAGERGHRPAPSAAGPPADPQLGAQRPVCRRVAIATAAPSGSPGVPPARTGAALCGDASCRSPSPPRELVPVLRAHLARVVAEPGMPHLEPLPGRRNSHGKRRTGAARGQSSFYPPPPRSPRAPGAPPGDPESSSS